jgi:hypothetical protein
LAIGFLAGLLGIGDPSKEVRGIMETAQAPVNKAIDWVINKAIQLVKAAGKLFGFGKEEKAEEDPEKQLKIEAGLAALNQEEQNFMKDGKISREDAEKVAVTVRGKHQVFKSITVESGDATWDFEYVASPGKRVKGAEKKEGAGDRVVTAFHGSEGDGILGIISTGMMRPSRAGGIFLGMQHGLFLHGGDTSRKAAFVIQVELTFKPEQIETERKSTYGVDDTLLLKTPQEVHTRVIKLIVRRPTGEESPPFNFKEIYGESEIADYLRSGWRVDLEKEGQPAEEDPEKAKKIKEGLEALDKLQQNYLVEGKISREDAEKVAAKIKSDHPVFKSLVVVNGGGTWDYDYTASPGKKSKGKPQAPIPDHRGSVQIQGKMLKQEQYRSWARAQPMPARDALSLLRECYNGLQAREQSLVNPAYTDAQDTINSYQKNGGHWVPPNKPGNIKSHYVPGVRGSELRVDLENHKGGAFV